MAAIMYMLVNCNRGIYSWFHAVFHPSRDWRWCFWSITLFIIIVFAIILCAPYTCFDSKDTSYRQIYGVAMGSPLGPTLPNVYLFVTEKRMHNTTG